MRAAALLAAQRGLGDAARDGEHVEEDEAFDGVGADAAGEPLPAPHRGDGAGERAAVALDADHAPEERAQRGAEVLLVEVALGARAGARAAQVHGARRRGGRGGRRREARAVAEDEALEERVRREPVGAVEPARRDLARGEEARIVLAPSRSTTTPPIV